MSSKPNQRGQALALVAIAIVGMLAITALAIDGGNVFTERRKAQSAADDAALAGGLAVINNPGVTGVTSVISTPVYGITSAGGNDFPNAVVAIARGAARSDGARGAQFTACDGSIIKIAAILTSKLENSDPVNHPTDYLQVIIRSTVKPYFGQIVGIHQLNYCVQAIVRAKPFRMVPVAYGDAVVGMDPNGSSFHAQSNAQHWTITGGGIFANNNAEDTHSNVNFLDNHCVTAVGSASGFICGGSYPNPQMKYNYPGNITDPQLGDVSYLMPTAPACDGTAFFKASDGKIHEDNDASKDGSVWTNGIAGDYAPGVYCITDAGGNIHSQITGTGVTFYITDPNFTMKFNGGGYFAASAPTTGKYKGLLMFAPIVDPPCSQNIEIRGNGSTPITGTLFMPSACIDWRGNGLGHADHSQIIGYDVSSNGNADVYVEYNSDENLEFPQAPVMELNK